MNKYIKLLIIVVTVLALFFCDDIISQGPLIAVVGAVSTPNGKTRGGSNK